MLQKLIRFIKLPNSKHIIVNTLGNYLNVFFTALFALILWQILSPEKYGVLSVLLGIAYVLANVLDFGTTATIYSYVPSLLDQKREHLYRFIKSTFFYQSLFSFIIIGILFLTFPYLDKVFFKTDAPEWELYLTAISVLFLIWQNFTQNILFAAKKFIKTNIYLNVANVIKTLVILYLASQHLVTVGSILFVFGILGPVIFFILLFIERRDLVFILMKAEVRREEFRFGYTLTYLLATQFANLGQRMDLFLLSFFRMKSAVGYYGISQKIILTVITTVISITQVLSPGFSKIKTKREALFELKTGVLYLLIPSGLFLLLFLLPDQIFILFFQKQDIKAAAIEIASLTKALSMPFLLYVAGTLPTLFLLYTVKKPRYILLANIVFFLIVTGGCIYLIPRKGAFGPPYALAAGFLIADIILMFASLKEYRKLPR